MRIVLAGLFLPLLLSACATTRIKYVTLPPAPLHSHLLAATPLPDVPEPFTWGSCVELNVQLYSALGQCNLDKEAVRKIEKERSPQ
ncbi:hypothetical protein [Entomohabitans teleogrylli]|uniref:Rz1-like lysis system protein LysC n=1 Tax=Entomohabitans teleogrylli TaxID=1384589 RepID=UPI0008FC6AA4